MPEGPEVETIRMGLDRGLAGQRIREVDVFFGGSLKLPEADFRGSIVGAKVVHVRRRGKVLMIELDTDQTILVHLKMTGQLVLVKRDGERYAGGHPTESMANSLPDRSSRLSFEFESGDRLFFNDQRKFGWLKLVPSSDVNQEPLLGVMGPEVISDEFNEQYLTVRVKRHPKAPIKAILLDQAIVAGIGNIYADETLNLAKIHPATPAGSLRPAQIKILLQSAKTIMQEANRRGGTTFSHYVNSFGGRGDYLDHARVFQRTGLPCPACGAPIEKIRVAGRGTHICPVCQKLPRVKRKLTA